MKILNIQTTRGDLVGTGWLQPTPDLRDYTEDHNQVRPMIKKLGIEGKAVQQLSADLRKWCSPVENQGKLGSCTAHAAAGIIEYYERRAFNKHIEASRLFLYKVTRNLMQTTGDTGGWIRCTMGAIALCGVPAEKYWPYVVEKYDTEPPAFVYSIADNYEAVKYFMHDPVGREQGAGSREHGVKRAKNKGKNQVLSGNKPFALSPEPSAPASREDILLSVKSYIEAGIPSMFGFWGFPSYDKSDVKGGIPYPAENESAQWGHAVVAIGFDDNKEITNTVNNKTTQGALLIRNSWGKEWGDNGYGWLPYDYVLNNLALDFWSLVSMEWVETNQFGV
ncbi:MAG TPA: C1 family peptidase [Bacteroidales bacterium]|nr:C1 family peptidase [Bacteroidales bacterium]